MSDPGPASSGDERPRAKKSLGQHFLIDPNFQRKIVDAVDPSAQDEILEIGPGPGALTSHLVGRAGRLVLIELDDRFAADHARRWAGHPEVEVRHADALEVPLTDVTDRPGSLKVVGNIPYNITSPLLFHLLERPRPAQIVVMVQREVADRLLAEPGTSAYGALAVGVRSVADVQKVLNVPRGAFRPIPKVDSTVLRITPHAPPRPSVQEEKNLRTLVRALFQWRRKQLQKILREHPDLSLDRGLVEQIGRETGRDLTQRPEELSPDELLELSRRIAGRARH